MPSKSKISVKMISAVLLGTAFALGSLLHAPDQLVSVNAGEVKTSAKAPNVFIIRHAEKTGEKDDVHLSKQGKERADVLYQIFEKSSKRANPFPRPDFIFAAKDSKNSKRPFETVEVFAKKIGVPINTDYQSKSETTDNKAMRDLAKEIRTQPKYAGKIVLVSWRHGVLPELAREFLVGAPNRDKVEPSIPKKWGDDVFDRVWQIRYDDLGNATFIDHPQALMPGDSAK